MFSDFEKKILRSMNNYVMQITTLLPGFKSHLHNDGYVFSCLILANSKNSFDAISILLKKEYILEANSVCRYVYEQFCYALAISDKPLEEIKKIEVTKTIKSLKVLSNIYPQLYGNFSSYAHLKIWDLYKFTEFETGQNGLQMIYIKEYKRNVDNDLLGYYVALVIILASIVEYLAEKNDESCIREIKSIHKRLTKTIAANWSKIVLENKEK